jgi:hypothetical protein
MLMLFSAHTVLTISWVYPELIFGCGGKYSNSLCTHWPSFFVFLDVLQSVSDPDSSVRHELRIRTFFEDNVSAFPRFVID